MSRDKDAEYFLVTAGVMIEEDVLQGIGLVQVTALSQVSKLQVLHIKILCFLQHSHYTYGACPLPRGTVVGTRAFHGEVGRDKSSYYMYFI